MFSVGLSPSSNQRMSQANRMDGPVSTVNEVVKWGALGCRRVVEVASGSSVVRTHHSDVLKKNIQMESGQRLSSLFLFMPLFAKTC